MARTFTVVYRDRTAAAVTIRVAAIVETGSPPRTILEGFIDVPSAFLIAIQGQPILSQLAAFDVGVQSVAGTPDP